MGKSSLLAHQSQFRAFPKCFQHYSLPRITSCAISCALTSLSPPGIALTEDSDHLHVKTYREAEKCFLRLR